MAWTNKRKIHVARGSTANIVALDNEEENKFTDGQPLFNKDRGYLGIATGTQEAKNIVPIKVREVAGWTNELDSNGVYTLNSAQDGYYSFGGGKDGNVHLATQKDFILEKAIKNQDNTYDFSSVFEYLVQNNQLNFNVPINANNNIVISGNKYLKSRLIHVNEIKDLNSNNSSQFASLIFNANSCLDGLYSTYMYGVSDNADHLTMPNMANVSTGLKINTIDGTTSSLVLGKNVNLVSQTNSFLYGANNLIGNNFIYGVTKVLPKMKWIVDNEYGIPTIEEESVLGTSSKLYIGVPVEIDSNITMGRLKIYSSKYYYTPGSMSPASVLNTKIEGLDELLCATIGENSNDDGAIKPNIYANTINSLSHIASSLTVNGTSTFNGNITATGQKIACKSLEVTSINLVV